MQNRDVFTLLDGLNAVGNLTGVKFVYAVARTRQRLERAAATLKEAVSPLEAFETYDRARQDLCQENAAKDEQGRPAQARGPAGIHWVIEPERQEAFDAATVALMAEHREAIAGRDQQLADYEKLLDEESDVDLYLVRKEDLPEAINAGQLIKIIAMVHDEDEEPRKAPTLKLAGKRGRKAKKKRG